MKSTPLNQKNADDQNQKQLKGKQMTANVKNYFDQPNSGNDNKFHLEGSVDYKYSSAEREIGTWIDGKTIYQKIIDFGALPSTTTKNVAHSITGLNLNGFLQASLVAYKSSPSTSTPLNVPGLCTVGASAGELALSIGATNVTAVSTADESAYTNSYVILKYTKA